MTFLFYSCLEKEPETIDILPEINLASAYSISNSQVDVSAHLLANTLNDEVEYGIVWAEKPSPTINDQKSKIGKINRGRRFTASLDNLSGKDTIFIRAYVLNKKTEVRYSNEIKVLIERPKYWKRLGDLDFEEGQFSGVAIKLNGLNLTFLRLNENYEWEQYLHYNGVWYDPELTWQKEKYSFPQFSPRQDPLFFTLNFSKDYTRPSAFLAGGYTVLPQNANLKSYQKDFYWVYDTQNYLEPLPFQDGPIAHFTLNRNEYFVEENNTNNVWSYFSLEQFIKKNPFPMEGLGYDFLGVATFENGYILAQKNDESEVLLFEYHSDSDSWKRLPNFPGNGRLDGVCFSMKNKIYYGLGRNTRPILGLSDIWEYDPKINKWQFYTTYPGAGNIKVMTADLGEYALIFGGYQVRESAAGAEKYFNANDTWSFKN